MRFNQTGWAVLSVFVNVISIFVSDLKWKSYSKIPCEVCTLGWMKIVQINNTSFV